MHKKIILINTSIIILYIISCMFIYNTNSSKIISINASIAKAFYKDSDYLLTLNIKKLNINKPVYKIDSNKNNVDYNVTILNNSTLPDNDESIIFLAAHSGEGKTAFFNDLDKLNINDKITINYQNKNYDYYVVNKYEEYKNGYININKLSDKQLVLTTCSKNKNKQLIINCIQKKN